MAQAPPPSEVAYYYPEPYWLAAQGDWIKNLLLFFDEVAILLPEYMRGREVAADPTLAGPLEERGLLRVLEPEWFVDEEATRKLTDLVSALIDAGAFDSLAQEPFAELSMSRMGSHLAHEAAHMVYAALAGRGLAKPTEDGVSVPLRRSVRWLYLVILAQLARETGARHGLDLHPTSDNHKIPEALSGFLDLDPMPTRGQVAAFDLQVVSPDLSAVPLDEILQFKEENRTAHRKYMQDLRSFAETLGTASEADRQRRLRDRQADLEEQARNLRRLTWAAWRSPKAAAGFSLGLVGASYSLATHNSVTSVIGALSAVLGMMPDQQDASVYSYLFKAARELPP